MALILPYPSSSCHELAILKLLHFPFCVLQANQPSTGPHPRVSNLITARDDIVVECPHSPFLVVVAEKVCRREGQKKTVASSCHLSVSQPSSSSFPIASTTPLRATLVNDEPRLVSCLIPLKASTMCRKDTCMLAVD